ncbi:MAG: TIGR01777 family protein [Candidatus Latescibacteria bacterium]|nr:TIGR01777 family protein [Candidatus Latescibacterota bacterium]
MKLIISGAGGLIGRQIVSEMEKTGAAITRLVRRTAIADRSEVCWRPESGDIDGPKLESHDCVIHLAGESISGLWTKAKKERILSSRISGTDLLVAALSALKHPPRLLICASASGYYGDQGSAILSEQDTAGIGFLARVCSEWESAAVRAQEAGINVIRLRLPMILSSRGGALAAMLPVFRLGLGGVLGSGSQYMSWCSLDEIGRIVRHCLERLDLSGPYNAGTPTPITNKVFTQALGAFLHKRTPLPVPEFLLTLLPGDMASEMLLASTRMHPVRLLESGYVFQHPDIASALRSAL